MKTLSRFILFCVLLAPPLSFAVSQKSLPSPTVGFHQNHGQLGPEFKDSFFSKINSKMEIAIQDSATTRMALVGPEKKQIEGRSATTNVVIELKTKGFESPEPEHFKTPRSANWILGNDPSRWKWKVPAFEKITFTDKRQKKLTLTAVGGNLQYTIDLAASARPDTEFEVAGAESLQVDRETGNLKIQTVAGKLELSAPKVMAVDPEGARGYLPAWRFRQTSESGFVVEPEPVEPELLAILGPPATTLPSTYSQNFPVTPIPPRTPTTGLFEQDLGSMSSGPTSPSSASSTNRVFFSTLFGGGNIDEVHAMDYNEFDQKITTVGITYQTLPSEASFPTTNGAFQTAPFHNQEVSALNNWPLTHHSSGRSVDGFVAQYDISGQEPQVTYCTFLGSMGNDYPMAVHVGGDGLITIGGFVEHHFDHNNIANNYPLTSSAVQTNFVNPPGHSDLNLAFRAGTLTQLKPNSAFPLKYSTYYSGTFHDDIRTVYGRGIGRITFGGLTSSPDLPGRNNFIVPDRRLGRSGIAYLTNSNGNYLSNEFDAFVAHIRPTAFLNINLYSSDPIPSGMNPILRTEIQWATYLGGYDDPEWQGSFEMVGAMEVKGNIITVAGRSNARLDGSFPVTSGAYQANTIGDDFDAFVTQYRVRANRVDLEYSTLIGGHAFDTVESVLTEPDGSIVIYGSTNSAHRSIHANEHCNCYPERIPYPTTPIAHDNYLNNGNATIPGTGCSGEPYFDTFITRLAPSETGENQLLASTFLGGKYDEVASTIRRNSIGQFVLTGWTHSTDYPVTMNRWASFNSGGPALFEMCPPTQSPRSNAADVFIARMSRELDDLMYSTAFGGKQDDLVRGMILTEPGKAVVAGYTFSNSNGNNAFGQFEGEEFYTTNESTYSEAQDAWGLHVGFYSGNAGFNLGENYLSAFETESEHVTRFGLPTSVGRFKPRLDVSRRPVLQGQTPFTLVVSGLPEDCPLGKLWFSHEDPLGHETEYLNITQYIENPQEEDLAPSDSQGISRHPISLLQAYDAPDGRVWVQALVPLNCQEGSTWVATDALEIYVDVN